MNMSGYEGTMEHLKEVVRTCPGIDNHAHNLLLPTHQDAYNLLSATTEATGDALDDAPRSLPHMRMVRQLRELYGCDKDVGWNDLMIARRELLEEDHDGLLRKCFSNIHTILMDDGLDDDTVHPYNWHDRYTEGKTFRIVRIETVAADILRGMYQSGRLQIGPAIEDEEICAEAWITFLGGFEAAIANFIRDEEVVGFKSVICYRTGLDVRVARDVDVATNGLDAFRDDYLPDCVEDDFRIETKGLNDCLLISTCRLLTAGFQQGGIAKPLQFHTGLGDNDISLDRSNPAHLQPLIEKFPDVIIVLLHSSYPYTRQAGYLATVFKNVYLDLGEVFPMVSRDGQEHIIRQAMEITPMSKLLYSTDAHHWAEVYWLADKQFRLAFERVLVDYVENEDLTVQQAIDAARDIYFNNANRIYNLDLHLPAPKKTPLQLTWKDEPDVTRSPNTSDLGPYDTRLLASFLEQHSNLDFICIQWLDYMAQLRARFLPVQQFMTLIQSGSRIGIAKGNTGTLQNDAVTPAVDSQGMIQVEPDLSTLRPTHSKDPMASATVLASFRDEDAKPLPACPRSLLQSLVSSFKAEFDITILAGFEIELVLLRRNPDDDQTPYSASDTTHAWSTLTPLQAVTTMPILAEIVKELLQINIPILQFHSESGPGQYEIVLPPLPVVTAIDTLIQTRQVITQIAHLHGYRATLHPAPLCGTGSGQHAHLSLNSSTLSASGIEEKEMSFFAAVLEHLPAICAFTLPNEASYARVRDDVWAGGSWCCWGTQNREAPLRRIGASKGGAGNTEQSTSGRWEVRCMDGLANPYLSLAAILGAGLVGVKEGLQMRVQDCRANPAKLSAEERKEMGILQHLPTSLTHALEGLEGDEVLKEVLGETLVGDYVAMKRSEKEMLEGMEELERRVWLIERY